MKFNIVIPFILLSLIYISCDKDEPVTPETVITFEAQTFEALETITESDEIGQVMATTNMSDPITFRITQNSDELLSITSDGILGLPTGKRFNFKTAASHQIVVEATNGKETTTATITINVVDVPDPFITTWKTNAYGVSNDNQITIPTVDGETYDFSIEWGDGTQDNNVTSSITHTYAAEGTYSVSITGVFPRIEFEDDGDSDGDKLLTIEQWGDIEWTSMESAFQGCGQVICNALDAPDLSQVTSTRSMFEEAYEFSGDLSNWDVSTITDMGNMFTRASKFNSDLSGWDVSNVTDMIAMFQSNRAFSGDISSWNTSNVTDMSFMFRDSDSFNGDLSAWDVSSVTNMKYMFYNTAFNADISNWNVSNVTQMDQMFRLSSFSGDISSWDVSQVTNMRSMFRDAGQFNGNLGNWDVSQVTDMNTFLRGTAFTTANYDALLAGWSNLTLQDNVQFESSAKYSSFMQSARDILTNTYNWTVSDRGVAP